MYWFILFFPLLIFPWGVNPSYTMPKYLYLLIFVLFTWLYIYIKKQYRMVHLTKSDFMIEGLLCLFLLMAGISTIFSVNPYTSIYGALRRYEGLIALFLYCSMFWFSFRFFESWKLQRVIPGIAIVSVLASVYGIMQHYFLDFLPRSRFNIDNTRSFSFFDNPNFFGSYLTIMLMVTITLYLMAQEKRKTLAYFFIICLAFIALIDSGTRSGLVGVFCGILFLSVFVILKRKFLWRKWITLLLTMAVLLTVIDLSENGDYLYRLSSIFSDSYKIASNHTTGEEGTFRLLIWEKSFPLVKKYFWTGSGPDTLELVFPNDKDTRAVFGDQIVDKAHNEYLQMAITLGVPALLTYLLLVMVVLRRAFKVVITLHGNEKIFMFGLIATVFCYLVQAFFNISVIPVAPLFWSILGITAAKATICFNKMSAKNPQKENANNYQSA